MELYLSLYYDNKNVNSLCREYGISRNRLRFILQQSIRFIHNLIAHMLKSLLTSAVEDHLWISVLDFQ